MPVSSPTNDTEHSRSPYRRLTRAPKPSGSVPVNKFPDTTNDLCRGTPARAQGMDKNVIETLTHYKTTRTRVRNGREPSHGCDDTGNRTRQEV